MDQSFGEQEKIARLESHVTGLSIAVFQLSAALQSLVRLVEDSNQFLPISTTDKNKAFIEYSKSTVDFVERFAMESLRRSDKISDEMLGLSVKPEKEKDFADE